jgi:acyl carrier protein
MNQILRDKLKGMILDLLELESNNILDDDDLFDNGLDSLGIIELVDWIEEEFKLKLPIQFLFQHASIDSIATYLEERL